MNLRTVSDHPLVRWGFVLLVLAFVSWGFRDRSAELLEAVRATSPVAVGAAAVLVLGGLNLTGFGWLGLLHGYGYRLPLRTGRAVFFVGQLGKYIPGGVWSMGAHAQLARAHAVPVKATVSASLTFLWVNLATAGLVVGAAAVSGLADLHVPGWLVAVGTAGSLVALMPPVLARLGLLFSAGKHPLRVSPALLGRLVLLMALTWTAYAGAVVALMPEPDWGLLPVAGGAFALAYALGVAVVVAPAGVGVRELTLIALLTPVTGLAAAGVIALMTRLLHTGSDLLLALVSWLVDRGRRTREDAADRPDLYDTRAHLSPTEGQP